LGVLAQNTERPNNALHAESLILLLKSSEALAKNESLDPILQGIRKVFQRSKGMAEFQGDTLIQIIQEMGDFLFDNTSYDDLLEEIISVKEKRAREGEAGLILLTRGQQKLAAGKKYDAIKLLGRAQQKLAMQEYKPDWVLAIVVCGLAYERIGLLWGARSNILIAANLTISEYSKEAKLRPQSLLLLQKLVWIELQLGRVPHALAWMEMFHFWRASSYWMRIANRNTLMNGQCRTLYLEYYC
jgi:hypothetical protein